MSDQQRSLNVQLQLGILPIHIETRRFRGTQLDNRICQLCDTQEVEDEIHFVCKCKLYNDLRKTMYRTVEHKNTDFYMYDNKDKFIFLVQKEWKILGNYILLNHGQNAHINYTSCIIMFISYLMYVKIKQTQ